MPNLLQTPPLMEFSVPDWGLFLQRIVWSLLILLLAWFIAHRVRRATLHALRRTRLDVNFALLLGRIAYFTAVGFGLIWILQIFEVNWATLAAAVGVFGLAISLGIQDVLKSFVAGTYLLAERPFRIGDRVSVKDQTGIVEDVSVRTTTLRTDEGIRVVVPNTVVFAEVIKVDNRKEIPAAKPSEAEVDRHG